MSETESEAPLMPPSPALRKRALVVAVGLALLALCVAGYLAVQSMAGRGIAGCGQGSGCSEVLASPYARVGFVLVSVLAAAIYLVVLLALGLRLTSRGKSKPADFLLYAAVPALIGAAGWFTYVQIVELKVLCPYCMTGHALGVALGITLLLVLRGGGVVRPWMPMFVGLVGVGLLVVAQVSAPSVPPPATTENAGAGRDYDRTAVDGRREIGLFGGELELVLQDGPYLGEPDAPQVLAVVFDYGCPHCREMHALLEQMQQDQGGFVIVPLPVSIALERNAHLNSVAEQFLDSYDLATLSLAVAAIDRQQWVAFDRWLFKTDSYRTAGEARTKAEELVGQAVLAQQLTGDNLARHHAAIDRNIELLALIPEPDRSIPLTTSPGAPSHLTERVYRFQPILDLLDRAKAGLATPEVTDPSR